MDASKWRSGEVHEPSDKIYQSGKYRMQVLETGSSSLSPPVASPHPSTGISPAEAPFNRKFEVTLPAARLSPSDSHKHIQQKTLASHAKA